MRWVPVGKLGKTHGLKGEWKFRPDLPEPAWLETLQTVRLEGDAPDAPPRRVAHWRGHPGRLILKLQGIDRQEEAQALVGRTLLARTEDFPPLPDGAYYWFQVEGLKAYDEQGRCYGTVKEILQTGSNEVYVVQGKGRELLLPVIDEVIREVDLEQHKLVFHAVAGLLEDDSL